MPDDPNTQNKTLTGLEFGTSKVASLVPTRPDADLAREHKARITEALQPVLEELSAAKRQGFDVQFSVNTDATGRSFLGMLRLVKEYA